MELGGSTKRQEAQQEERESGAAPGGRTSTVEARELVDSLKAPIIELGRSQGFEVVENYDLASVQGP